MLQGACVYRSEIRGPVLIMYKETYNYPGQVLVIIYNKNKCLYKFRTSTRKLTEMIPIEAKHILFKLPYDENENIMIEKWRIKVLKELKNNKENL